MTDYLFLTFVFLAAGVAAVPIAARLGLGSVLGYLIAGIVISPILSVFGVNVAAIQQFAEFGVVMMLFLVGLELEPQRLWEMRSRLLGLGGLQVSLTVLAVMGVAVALGQPWSVGLAIGCVFALSSTAIVLQTLGEKGLMASDGGRASFAVLLFQDVAVIPMLAFLPLLALSGAAGHGAAGAHGGGMSLVEGLPEWQAALVTLGAIALVVMGGALATRPLFRFIGTAGLRELFIATALLLVVGIALLMSLVGLSPALGTFLAGVVLANSEYRHELEADIDPVRALLLGLFFMTVGAGIDFTLLFASFGTVLALTLGLMALKCAVLLVVGQVFGIVGSHRWLFALGLAQAGEFGFVLLAFTVASNVIPAATANVMLLVVALSMLLTPALFILHDRLVARLFARSQERMPDRIDPAGGIIIAGHGRFGGIVNRMLRSTGYETTVIDYSAAHLEVLRGFGFQAYFGDATRPDLLKSAGIETARLLVIAIDDKDGITQMVKYVTAKWPHVHIIARAVDRHHVYHLYAAGCRDIVRETFDSSLRAGRSAFEALGMSREEAQRVRDEFEALDRASMIELASLYDPNVLAHENPAYVARARELQQERERQMRGVAAGTTPLEAEDTPQIGAIGIAKPQD